MADPVWIAPDGTQRPLDGSEGVKLLRGMRGRGMPPMENVADEIAGLDGSRPRLSRALAREIDTPALVFGTDLTDRLRTLASLFDPRRGDGRLRFGSRQLVCRYAQGMDRDESEGLPRSHQRMVVTFIAHDPLWQDVDPQVELVDVEANAFLSPDSETPWFSWSLVSSDAVGGFVVDNDGDDQAWPVWTVQGPGAGLLRLANDDSGEVIEISDVDLATGDKITIDTRPGRKTIKGPGDANLWPDLSDGSTLWPIETGSQTITVELEGAVAGESNVRLEWRRRHLTV